MEAIDYWKLCSEYSIVQAALLIGGALPDELQNVVESDESRQPAGYVPVRIALLNGVQNETIRADVQYVIDEYGNEGSVNLHQTMIAFSELKKFLKANRMDFAFFDRPDPDVRMDSETAKYPPKLDAAIKAWTAVTGDPERLKGKSPKQALNAWLIEHAAELGLLNRHGGPNRHGIEDICKVANWKPKGGATPTYSAATAVRLAPTPLMPPDLRSNETARTPRETFTADLDDEIPF